jgi:hypothetical protein
MKKDPRGGNEGQNFRNHWTNGVDRLLHCCRIYLGRRFSVGLRRDRVRGNAVRQTNNRKEKACQHT